MNKNIYHLLLILYCSLIFILSSVPGENFPKSDFEFSDKLVHFAEYSVLYILFFYSLKNQSKYTKLQNSALEFALLFTSLYGISDELHQYFVSNRSCEFSDWAADTAGALLMYLLFKIKLSRLKTTVSFLSLSSLIISFIIISGCVGSEEKSKMSKPEITVVQTEAWLDFMPVVGDEDKNRFGFVVKLKFSGKNLDTNYNIADFDIDLNNDKLLNKKFNTRIENYSDTVFYLELYQSYNEKYLDKAKEYPEEVTFKFNINRNNKTLKEIETPKIKILKTQ